MGVTGGGGAMTVDLCTSACQAAGYILAGVEYGEECCILLFLSNHSVVSNE